MDRDLIITLEFEYWSIREDNPDWDMTLWDFLVERGIPPDDIWGFSPEIGWSAKQPEPDWL